MKPIHLLVAAAGLAGAPAHAGKGKKSEVEHDPDWKSAPAAQYAALDTAGCHAALRKRKIEFEVVARAPGVMAPVRIPKGVGGIVFRTMLPRDQGKNSPWEIFDCRLVLALDDFAAILARHDVAEALIFSAWRPPPKSWPEAEIARRHPGGLAVDVLAFLRKKKRDDAGEQTEREPIARAPRLDVEKHFGGKIGSESCGPKARPPNPKTDEASELREIYCDAAAQRIFTSMLSPNYDRAHHNHFHLEITPDVRWRMVR
jgi:hypothetical protein